MSTTKLYTVAGTSTFNGKTKVRFANDYVSRFKILTKNGHENIEIMELSKPMSKAEVCKFLQSHEKFQTEAQQSAINRLQQEKRGLMETATKLSETYDDLTVSNQKLSSRLEMLLLKVQQQLPVRSDAELRMQRELLDVERKMKNLKNGKFLKLIVE